MTIALKTIAIAVLLFVFLFIAFLVIYLVTTGGISFLSGAGYKGTKWF